MQTLILVTALGCARTATTATTSEAFDHGASRGVENAALAELLESHWEGLLRADPVWATSLGDHRFDTIIAPVGPAARDAHRSRVEAWQARAVALKDLSAADALTRDLLVADLDADLRADACRFAEWSFSARSNPLGEANYLAEVHPLTTAADGASLLARVGALPESIDASIDDLKQGLAAGLVTNRGSAERVVAMFDRQLAKPLEDWPLMAPALADLPWREAEAFKTAYRSQVEQGVVPALRRYRALVADAIVPAARGEGNEGIGALPLGECYRGLIEQHTTLPLTADEVHATGLVEMAKIHDEFRVIGLRVFGTDDLAAIFEQLRTDSTLYFETEESVESAAVEALARAEAVMPEWFGRLPQAPCTVERVPDYEAPYTTIAYYRPGAADGSRPGAYFVNTYAPETRPRHEAEVLAFHESIPGHHLQIAIAQELEAVPAFRRHGGKTAFVEGWALYTERLADEMGLYTGDVDRLGMLSFDAWRAGRLVVDTGVHAKGWSRSEAEAWLGENTPLAHNNIENEVDRYIAWPGQALGYKIGQIEMWALRREAEAALGDRFDVAAFHDVVLSAGPVTLPVVRARVRAWITAAQ